jgi:hypothetical protein
MMATLRGYLFTLIAHRPLRHQGTRGSPGAALGWAAGAEAAGHVAAPELPGLGSTGWCHRTRGGPGAAPGLAVRAGSVGHVVATELPRAVRFMLRLTTRRDV